MGLGFLALIVLAGLAADLLAHRGQRGTSRTSAVVWIALGLAFGGWIAFEFGQSAAEDFLRRHLRVAETLHGHRSLALERGRRVATPLLLALLVVKATDVLFAVDSIPAVFAITQGPFLVDSSNIFALLGLHALFLIVATSLQGLKYLHHGLAGILGVAGMRMLTSHFVEVPPRRLLAVIVGILAAAVVPSLAARRRLARASDSGPTSGPGGDLATSDAAAA